MKTSAGILASIGFAGIGLAACGGGSDDGGGGGGASDANSPGYQAFLARDAFMQELGDAIIVLNEMSSEERPADEAAFREAVVVIATRAPMLLDHFEDQTIAAESRTKPEVFANWDDFRAKNDALVAAASALNEATSGGGFAAGRGLVVGVRDTCGGCHRPYRGPEKE